MTLISQTKPDARSLVVRTLWRIETTLYGAPSLADLARGEGVSAFHLSRAFSMATGQSIMAYARARRLSAACDRLRETADAVLTIALDVGYDSHEGFTRAFHAQFGVTPSQVRSTPDLLISRQEPIEMPSQKTPLLQPRFQNAPTMKIVGLAERFTVTNRAAIPRFWDRAVAAFGNRIEGNESFGVCFDMDDDSFQYLIGIEDDGNDDASMPDHLRIPAGRYAVFRHTGHISSIAGTWRAIFDDWLPNSGTALAEGPEIERYAPDFDPQKPGGVTIWIPVEPE